MRRAGGERAARRRHAGGHGRGRRPRARSAETDTTASVARTAASGLASGGGYTAPGAPRRPAAPRARRPQPPGREPPRRRAGYTTVATTGWHAVCGHATAPAPQPGPSGTRKPSGERRKEKRKKGLVTRWIRVVADEWTAVYDISARTVYMPDGTKLEAHSGFGKSLDDPAQVAEKISVPHPRMFIASNCEKNRFMG